MNNLNKEELIMKKFIKLVVLFIFSTIFLAACNDDEKVLEMPNQIETSTPPASKSDYLISNQYQIDENHLSPNQDVREMFLVLHYTAITYQETLKRFGDENYQASSHYLIPELPINNQFVIYRMVPDNKRAWHAGLSFWQGNRSLNASSIGIEIENLGFPEADENQPLMLRRWYPYASKKQIEVVAEVAKRVINEYGITPSRVVGHSDIAPGRKFDPGPLFPWEQLYKEYNIGAWFDEDTVSYYKTYFPWKNDVSDLQIKLSKYGYDINITGVYDQATKDVVSAFQMHFYPQKYDGQADMETVARLDALLEKYRGQSRPAF